MLFQQNAVLLRMLTNQPTKRLDESGAKQFVAENVQLYAKDVGLSLQQQSSGGSVGGGQ